MCIITQNKTRKQS